MTNYNLNENHTWMRKIDWLKNVLMKSLEKI